MDVWDCDMIETDVRLSSDGHVMTIHDATVDRTTDAEGPVLGYTARELEALDAGARFVDPEGRPTFRGRGEGVPRLDHVLEAFPTMRFNVEAKEARATAKMRFRTGQAGTPVFDLRQPLLTGLTIDGNGLDPLTLGTHEFGESTGTMRILNVELEANSVHELYLEYPLLKPLSPEAQEIGWADGGVHWDTYFSDLNHGRYLEMWFPANLLYDQHPFTLTVQVTGADEDHELVTNGTVETLGEHHWRMSFPPSYTAFSPMVVLIPGSRVDRSQSVAKLADGRSIRVDVCSSEPAEVISRQRRRGTRSSTAPLGSSTVASSWSSSRCSSMVTEYSANAARSPTSSIR